MMFVLPLLAALVYVAAALLLKRAGELGAGIWRIAWICNSTAAVVFSSLLFLGGATPSWNLLWQPAIVALMFVIGQVFTFRSLQVGDVSVATPVLGLKIIFVALLTPLLLTDRLTAGVWIAAILSSIAIVLLNLTGGAHRRVGLTVLLASGAAASFALFDVLVQRWSPAWGAGRFLPITMLMVGLMSQPMRWRATERRGVGATWWLCGGAFCLATQSVLFVSAVALFGEATRANVLYSTRGLWSVVAVWVVGHWFRSSEQHLGRRVLVWRLVGAALLMSAVVLVVLTRAKP
jgi:drug/metabolite transporter (DMT)-like permease